MIHIRRIKWIASEVVDGKMCYSMFCDCSNKYLEISFCCISAWCRNFKFPTGWNPKIALISTQR